MTIVAKMPEPDGARRRRRRLRSLAFTPTVLTLGNLICGFAAIHFALRAMYDLGAGVPEPPVDALPHSWFERLAPSFLSVGAGLVIVGMVLDLLDGLVARVTRSTTNFGGQLDSLADMVTFGAAPAVLMVAFMTQELAGESILPSPISDHVAGRAAWISAAVYVAFGAVRLARFNVEHAQADYDFRTFRGLPIPGAAAVVVAMILFQEQMGETGRTVVVYSLPVVALLIAFLMVSRIPYRRFYRAYLLGKRPFSQVMTLIALLAACLLIKAPTLLLIVLWYALSGPLLLVARLLRGTRVPAGTGTTSQTSADRKHA
jgi:CDP-diacylglycerol--serine O-phosphatidyltransferase